MAVGGGPVVDTVRGAEDTEPAAFVAVTTTLYVVVRGSPETTKFCPETPLSVVGVYVPPLKSVIEYE
jgi:hypothetical protein